MNIRWFDHGLHVYEASKVVSIYEVPDLQPAEQILLTRLKPDLGQMNMLDLGVGAGRTARHFASLVRSYVGVDYSKAMIEKCKSALPAFTFVVGDARQLDFVASSTIDIVLFSFNGIDHVDFPDRNQILCEMKRVLRPGGVMIFSTHNLNYLPRTLDGFRFRPSLNLRATLSSLKWWMIFYAHNPLLLFRLPVGAVRLYNGVHRFRSLITFIAPDRQVEALNDLQMTEISCASYDNGEFLLDGNPRIAGLEGQWIYYICRKPADAEPALSNNAAS